MSTDATTVSVATNQTEIAVSYAALILADEGIEITSEKLQNLLKAAHIEDIEPIWTTLFAKALQGKEVKNILTAFSTSVPEVERQNPLVDEPDQNEPDEGIEILDGGDGNDSDMEGGMLDLFG